MILLDTHIFVWWVSGSDNLSDEIIKLINSHESSGIYISIISIWEIAKLHEKGRLRFDQTVEEWIKISLLYPGVSIIDLEIPIILESIQLPGNFHSDPADQLIVATSRLKDLQLLTADKKILSYEHVNSL